MAADIPRALKLAVGLTPSSLTYHRSPSRGAWCNGVKPSPSEIGLHGGRTSRYRHIVGSRSARVCRSRVDEVKSYWASNGLPHVQVLIGVCQSNVFPQSEQARWVSTPSAYSDHDPLNQLIASMTNGIEAGQAQLRLDRLTCFFCLIVRLDMRGVQSNANR